MLVNISFVGFNQSLPLWIVHLESTITIFFIQYKRSNLVIATQAAQTQFTTTFISSFFLPVILREFITQANTTIAVQC